MVLLLQLGEVLLHEFDADYRLITAGLQYIYIYIYIERERERDAKRAVPNKGSCS